MSGALKVKRTELRIFAWRKPNGKYRTLVRVVPGDDALANGAMARLEPQYQAAARVLEEGLNRMGAAFALIKEVL